MLLVFVYRKQVTHRLKNTSKQVKQVLNISGRGSHKLQAGLGLKNVLKISAYGFEIKSVYRIYFFKRKRYASNQLSLAKW